jgi:histone H3
MARTKQTVLESRGRFNAGVNLSNARLSGAAGGSKAGTGGSMAVKKKQRWRPGTVALREIRQYQKSTKQVIRKRPFLRLIRERGEVVRLEAGMASGLRYERASMEMLQEMVEAWTVVLMEDAQLVAIHAKRVRVQCKDILLVARMRHGMVRRLMDGERRS